MCVSGQADSSTIRRGWSATRDAKHREASVNCLTTADINGDGAEELVVRVLPAAPAAL